MRRHPVEQIAEAGGEAGSRARRLRAAVAQQGRAIVAPAAARTGQGGRARIGRQHRETGRADAQHLAWFQCAGAHAAVHAGALQQHLFA
ncbi:hypothetical protein LP419_01590 [Massilia sp. H-1]|nr:hypothetical protein LP419_01590 [Massilia sp. H-1]